GTVVHPNLSRRAESGHHDIEFAVMIEIADGGATVALGWQGSEASFLCQGRELVAAQVPENCVGLINLRAAGHVGRLHMSAGNEDILPSVIVEVGDVGAVCRHGVTEGSHPGP